MYLISLYFDDETEKKICSFINKAAEKSNNYFMIDGNVPPHVTISSFYGKDEKRIIDSLGGIIEKFRADDLQWVSVGCFPGVLYLAVVLNEYLHSISVDIYDVINKLEGVNISRKYRPFQWLPHTTVAKSLSEEQINVVFAEIQKEFSVFQGKVVKIGLACTNPYHDIKVWELK